MALKRRMCKACKKNRREDFYSSPRAKTCRDCLKKNRRNYSRDTRLQETYGITEDEYRALLDKQGGKCAICGGTRRYNLDVDHDHKDERLRGLLCKACNRRLLPNAKDSIEILKRAIEYLEAPPAQALWPGRVTPAGQSTEG